MEPADSKLRPDPEGRITLRTGHQEDVDFIRDLSRQVFIRYGPYDRLLPQWHLNGTATTILALLDHGPAGFAMLGRAFYDMPLFRVHELLAIAVQPEMQRGGIGGALLKRVVTMAGARKADVLVLHTALENIPARRLFKQHGFEMTETRPGFYQGGQDAVVMVRYFSRVS